MLIATKWPGVWLATCSNEGRPLDYSVIIKNNDKSQSQTVSGSQKIAVFKLKKIVISRKDVEIPRPWSGNYEIRYQNYDIRFWNYVLLVLVFFKIINYFCSYLTVALYFWRIFARELRKIQPDIFSLAHIVHFQDQPGSRAALHLCAGLGELKCLAVWMQPGSWPSDKASFIVTGGRAQFTLHWLSVFTRLVFTERHDLAPVRGQRPRHERTLVHERARHTHT